MTWACRCRETRQTASIALVGSPPQAGRKVLKDLRALLRGHVHAIVGHVLEHPVPTIARASDGAVKEVERMAPDAGADDECPVRPLRHARIVLRLSGCHMSTQYTGNDADQQPRRFHSRTPFQFTCAWLRPR